MMASIFHQQADELHCQKEERKSKNRPPIMYACPAFDPRMRQRAHEGHFITEHATPMCTEIDHKSPCEHLRLILKRGPINKTPRWQKCEWKGMSGRTPLGSVLETGAVGCIHGCSATFGVYE